MSDFSLIFTYSPFGPVAVGAYNRTVYSLTPVSFPLRTNPLISKESPHSISFGWDAVTFNLISRVIFEK